MKKILLATLLFVTSMFAQQLVAELPQTTTNTRIEIKLKELGFCCNVKTISKVAKFAGERTTDRELEDVILEYI